MDDNNRVSKIILSETLSSNNTYSPSPSINVYDVSSPPLIPVTENMTTDLQMNETQNENLGSTYSEDIINLQQPTNEPYKGYVSASATYVVSF